MAGDEMEDGHNARNPADDDDPHAGSNCVPFILFVQWLFDDHVDALIGHKYQDLINFKHLQDVSDGVPEPSDEDVDEDDFKDDEDSKTGSGSTSLKADPIGRMSPAGSSPLGEVGPATLPCDRFGVDRSMGFTSPTHPSIFLLFLQYSLLWPRLRWVFFIGALDLDPARTCKSEMEWIEVMITIEVIIRIPYPGTSRLAIMASRCRVLARANAISYYRLS